MRTIVRATQSATTIPYPSHHPSDWVAPLGSFATFNRGYDYYEAGEYDLAIAEFDAAIN